MDKMIVTIYFRAVCAAIFAGLAIVGITLRWSVLTISMCVSLAACFAIFTFTARKEKKWVDENKEHNDGNHYHY